MDTCKAVAALGCEPGPGQGLVPSEPGWPYAGGGGRCREPWPILLEALGCGEAAPIWPPWLDRTE